jgi:hypothetical protein
LEVWEAFKKYLARRPEGHVKKVEDVDMELCEGDRSDKVADKRRKGKTIELALPFGIEDA